MNEKSCGTCQFFVSGSGKDEWGDCRKTLPTVHTIKHGDGTLQHLGVWPLVCDADWCGEFAKKHELYPSVPDIPLRSVLSARASNSLKREGAISVRDMVGRSVMDLEEARNIGKVSIDEIKRVLADNGLKVSNGVFLPQ